MTKAKGQTLEDVCDFIVDCLHKTAPTQDDGYPSIRTPNVGRGRLVLDGVNRVSEGVYEEWTQRAVPVAGDLIMAREAPAGNVAIIKEGQIVCLGQRTVHLRPNRKKVDPDFLCYYLLAPKQQGKLLAGETGATAGHVNMKDIRRLSLGILPDLKTQEAAAKTIAAYDDLMENNKKRIALLEDSARLLYREWFVHLRFPGHEHVRVTNGAPSGWSRKRIADITEFLGRGISPSYADDGSFLVVNQKCIRDRLLSMAPARRQQKEYADEKSLRHLDVLINSTGTGTLGRVAQCWFLPTATTFDSHVTVARAKSNLDALWFGYALLELQPVFEGMGEGATNQKELSRSRLADVQVLTPPPTLQTAFGLFAKDVSNQIWLLTLQNAKLAEARDLLLPRLMSKEIAA